MSKLLVVPDVHGRSFWKKPCKEWQDKIVFLGDYHDPYPNELNNFKSLKNLKELVSFYKDNKDRIITLCGNHDMNYLIDPFFADRVDYFNMQKVKGLLEQLNLQVAYLEDDVLFSHSGVLPRWLNIHKLTIKDLPNLPLNHKALKDVSIYRGGSSKVGGILFGDVREYVTSKHVPDLYQVFGHTQLKEAHIGEDFACLDCRKCFVMDLETKEIKEYA